MVSGLALAALVFGSAAVARAQSVDEVVDKTIAALGGREALSKLTSRSTTGKISVSSPAGNIPGTVEVSNQAPNKVRTLISLDLSSLGAGAMTVDQRFDGSAAYAMDSMQGNRDITGDQLANMKNADFPTPLLRYKERGTKIELGPREKVGDRDAQVLLITPQAGPPSKLYVDTQTWLPARLVQTLELPEVGRIEQSTDLSDYRDVDGVKVAFAIHNASAVQTVNITVDKVENNVKIDPTLFSKPGGAIE
jgi:outer membrane lipoprotein-sorting protein